MKTNEYTTHYTNEQKYSYFMSMWKNIDHTDSEDWINFLNNKLNQLETKIWKEFCQKLHEEKFGKPND